MDLETRLKKPDYKLDFGDYSICLLKSEEEQKIYRVKYTKSSQVKEVVEFNITNMKLEYKILQKIWDKEFERYFLNKLK